MYVTLTKAEYFEPLQQAWKEMGAPCHLRRTKDPLRASVCLNKGVDPVQAQLFVLGFISTTKGERRVNEG